MEEKGWTGLGFDDGEEGENREAGDGRWGWDGGEGYQGGGRLWTELGWKGELEEEGERIVDRKTARRSGVFPVRD